ncbi:MAG: hypothetical protein ACYCWW_12950 [Deltaproteobacteria bacterium]
MPISHPPFPGAVVPRSTGGGGGQPPPAVPLCDTAFTRNLDSLAERQAELDERRINRDPALLQLIREAGRPMTDHWCQEEGEKAYREHSYRSFAAFLRDALCLPADAAEKLARLIEAVDPLERYREVEHYPPLLAGAIPPNSGLTLDQLRPYHGPIWNRSLDASEYLTSLRLPADREEAIFGFDRAETFDLYDSYARAHADDPAHQIAQNVLGGNGVLKLGPGRLRDLSRHARPLPLPFPH